MASSIEWLLGGETWNTIRAELLEDIVDKTTGEILHHKGEIGWFCIKTSPGCKECYACAMNLWRGNGLEYIVPNLSKVRIFLDENTALKPLHWKKPRLIFPCSMTDWMGDFVKDVWRDRMMAVMASTPQHTYLSLTKQAETQRHYLSDPQLYKRVAAWMRTGCVYPAQIVASEFEEQVKAMLPLKNHWVGVSAEDQPRADERIPELLRTRAALRWVSLEPLLGAIDLEGLPSVSGIGRFLSALSNAGVDPGAEVATCLDWGVIGLESGAKARAGNIEWIRQLVAQFRAAGVPVFVKQLGAKPYLHKQESVHIDEPGLKFSVQSLEINSTFKLNDPKGGDMSEWPKDLQVREYPKIEAVHA